LVGALTLLGMWEFYTMLDQAAPNFKIIGMICTALFVAGSFYYLGRFGIDHAHDFEVAALLLSCSSFLPANYSRERAISHHWKRWPSPSLGSSTYRGCSHS
jgi:hypothetical protein